MGADTSPHVPRFTGFDHRHQRRCLKCAFSAPRPQHTPIRDSALRALLPACRLDLRHCGKRASEHIEEGHEVSAWHQPGLADQLRVLIIRAPLHGRLAAVTTPGARPLPARGRRREERYVSRDCVNHTDVVLMNFTGTSKKCYYCSELHTHAMSNESKFP